MTKQRSSVYRKMRVDLWSHPRTRDLSAIAKLLMLFLLRPHPAGISTMSVVQMRNGMDRRMRLEEVDAALRALVDAGLVEWDAEHEVVWVVEALDEQIISEFERHPNWAKNVMSHLDTLPPSSLVPNFLVKYGDWLRRSDIDLGSARRPDLRVVPQQELFPDDQPRTYSHVQHALIDAFSRALGCPVNADTVTYAMDRWQEKDATEHEILQVVKWWSENKRVAACDLRMCFARYGQKAAWSRISAEVLGRQPAARSGRRSAPASIDDTRAAYNRDRA